MVYFGYSCVSKLSLLQLAPYLNFSVLSINCPFAIQMYWLSLFPSCRQLYNLVSRFACLDKVTDFLFVQIVFSAGGVYLEFWRECHTFGRGKHVLWRDFNSLGRGKSRHYLAMFKMLHFTFQLRSVPATESQHQELQHDEKEDLPEAVQQHQAGC